MKYYVFTYDFRYIGSVYGDSPTEAFEAAKLKYWLAPGLMVSPA